MLQQILIRIDADKRNIRQRINCERQKYKTADTLQAEPGPVTPCFLPYTDLSDFPDHPEKKNDKKSTQRIDPRPLCCTAKSRKQTGKQQIPPFFRHHKCIHKIEHTKNKKRDYDIDRGNSGKCKMHKIRSKQDCCQTGISRFSCQTQTKQIDKWHHQASENDTHKPPAKRIHAKDRNSDRDQCLSKRRMRIFINRQSMQKFVGSSAMINLIKDRLILISNTILIKLLFIKKRRILHGIHR